MTQCQQTTEYPAGPHPGCAEFDGGATFEVRCTETATHRATTTDDLYPGEDRWLLCDEHTADLLHDAAVGEWGLHLTSCVALGQHTAPRRGLGTRHVEPRGGSASYAFTTIPRSTPQRGRGGTRTYHRNHYRSHAMVTEILTYGEDEHDGLVVARVVLAGGGPERTVTLLAEDIWIGGSPLEASHAAGVWADQKYPRDA